MHHITYLTKKRGWGLGHVHFTFLWGIWSWGDMGLTTSVFKTSNPVTYQERRTRLVLLTTMVPPLPPQLLLPQSLLLIAVCCIHSLVQCIEYIVHGTTYFAWVTSFRIAMMLQSWLTKLSDGHLHTFLVWGWSPSPPPSGNGVGLKWTRALPLSIKCLGDGHIHRTVFFIVGDARIGVEVAWAKPLPFFKRSKLITDQWWDLYCS